MRLALFQPDIPQNLGSAIRLSACFGVPLEVIEPCGFPLSDKSLKRAALDYGPKARILRHDGWTPFLADPARGQGRLILFTTRADTPLNEARFAAGDTLLFGRESAGSPDYVHDRADLRLIIPIQAETRSLNLATACAVAVWEALRQTGGLVNSRDG